MADVELIMVPVQMVPKRTNPNSTKRASKYGKVANQIVEMDGQVVLVTRDGNQHNRTNIARTLREMGLHALNVGGAVYASTKPFEAGWKAEG